MSEIRIALAGNPNCGKTTMFNSLTGTVQYVGNWPGVTVEKKEGKVKGSKDLVVTDLPGIYSLSPYTSEEVVSRDYLIKDNPDAILDLVDATNIERNLYLTTQLLELGKPTVIALNMIDVLKKSGDSVDTEKLQAELGCAVIETSALKGTGVKEAAAAAKKAAESGKAFIPSAVFSKDVEEYISKMEALVPSTVKSELKRWYAIKLLERDSVVLGQLALSSADSAKAEEISKALEKAKDDDVESIITNERYVYIQGIVSRCVRKSGQKMTRSDKIDRIVTNRWLGIPIFLAVMWVVYYIAVSSLGTVLTDWANDGLFGDGWNFLGIEGLAIPGISASVEEALTNAGANEVLIDCIVNGVIGGVGAVLGFVPQMAVLFLLLSLIEDCGYMVRIAFVMDRIFRKFGLSGKSFIPLLVGSGCGVPGIMASRTIENDNDRRLTIFTTTWVPCGAKLPVIALIAGVIGAKLTGWDGGSLTLLMYVIGIGAVVMAAIMLKKTKPFHGKAAPFVMELPQYHLPQLKTVLMHTWERLRGFIVKAGTILFVACLVIWFLSSYGFASPKDEVVENGEVVEEAVEGGFGLVDADESLLADVGNVIRYVFKPLGFGEKVGGWQSAAASLSGFSAKEAIVSTMGVLANVDEENVEDDAVVAEAIGGWFATALAAFAFLMFNLLDSPCLAAIATMANELKSRKWFWFAIIFQNVFAYVLTLIVYQLGMLFVHGHFGVGTVFAFVFLAGIIFALFRKDPYKGQYFDSKSAS
ncbi:ferrous iron transport protein B [uncultured Treponema sp.]|uniref:ferrous iron transport protein B n=1 Tax=uncultured Treponema sp. TaxID=162155 RepID=UPI0025CC62A4|nr:ferrous iron transport protein B [uncultured Treponema sp.]